MYSLVLTDRSYVPQADLQNVSGLSFFRGLSKLATVGFSVRVDNPQSTRLAAADGFVKLYRNGVLQFVGPVVSAEETAERDAQSLAVNCADAGWVLTRRVFGKGAPGSWKLGLTPRHSIAKQIIDAANVDGETGINTAAYTLSSGSSITYTAPSYVNLMTEVVQLGAALDGFDWVMRPIENWVNGAVAGTKVAGWQAATLLGSTQSNAVFEYGAGTRSNVLRYNITTTRDQQANKVYYAGQNQSDVKTGTNSAAITAWGLLEDVVSGDITDATMRQKVVDEHVLVRGNPRTLVKMTPHIDPAVVGRVPQPFTEYDVGDVVTFRAVNNGVVRFSGLLRVYGITVTLDDAGFERVELTLEDET